MVYGYLVRKVFEFLVLPLIKLVFLNELNQIEEKTRTEVLNYSAAIWLIMRLTLCCVCVYNLFHLHVRKTVTNA